MKQIKKIDGRRPSLRDRRTAKTKQAILESAQQLFASRGYAETGIREIAAGADVNSALIARYFGSKLNLFERVLRVSLDVSLFKEVPRETFGVTLAEIFCTAESDAAKVIPVLVFAAGDASARALVLEILEELVLTPLEEWFGGVEAEDRAAQLLMVVTSFFTFRLMLPIRPLEGRVSPGMFRWLAKSLQDIVDYK